LSLLAQHTATDTQQFVRAIERLVVVSAALALGWACRQATPQPPPGSEKKPAPLARQDDHPGAPLYATHCSGCHGIDAAGGRAHSLFDERWLSATKDDRILVTMQNGMPGTEMTAFNTILNDQQMWELVQYIRSQGGVRAIEAKPVADPDGQTFTTEHQTITLEVVARDLETPWGLAFLPDDRMLVTERPGRLRIIDKGRLSAPIRGIPKVHEQQDGGLLDVEVHPQYATNGWIYLAYAEDVPGFVAPAGKSVAPPPQGQDKTAIPSMTVVVRGKISRNNEWTNQQVIFRAPTRFYSTSGAHFGCRMLFDRTRHLFFTLGERGTMEDAQDLGKPMGKIHRVTDTGGIPRDNPFVGRADALGTIWSYGHRNPEGLAWDPVSGVMWESEHGPRGGDEINVIERGRNYGWGVVTKGLQNGLTKSSAPGMDDPIVYYTPSIGPSGIAFYTGDRYPSWRTNSLFVGGLVGQQLLRLQIDGRAVTHQEMIFGRLGRVRDIVQGPDGYFYVALQTPTGAGTGIDLSASTPGMIVRLNPTANRSLSSN
jgi:glucose/arabinose dehydrogenase